MPLLAGEVAAKPSERSERSEGWIPYPPGYAAGEQGGDFSTVRYAAGEQ